MIIQIILTIITIALAYFICWFFDLLDRKPKEREENEKS